MTKIAIMQSLIVCIDNTAWEFVFMVLLLAPPADQSLALRLGWVSWVQSSAQRLLVPVPAGINDLGSAVSLGYLGPQGFLTCNVCGDSWTNMACEGTWPWSSVPSGVQHHPSGWVGPGHQQCGGQGQLLAKGVFIRGLKWCCPFFVVPNLLWFPLLSWAGSLQGHKVPSCVSPTMFQGLQPGRTQHRSRDRTCVTWDGWWGSSPACTRFEIVCIKFPEQQSQALVV